jgi:hypothetical protein
MKNQTVTPEQAMELVRSIQRSIDTFSGSGESVRLDERSWEKMKRHAAEAVATRPRELRCPWHNVVGCACG